MNCQQKPLPGWRPAEVDGNSIPGGVCTSNKATEGDFRQVQYASPALVQASIKALQIDAAIEAGNIASIALRHFCDNCEIGSFAIAEHNMRVAILHMREAAEQYRNWQGKPLKQEASQ